MKRWRNDGERKGREEKRREDKERKGKGREGKGEVVVMRQKPYDLILLNTH